MPESVTALSAGLALPSGADFIDILRLPQRARAARHVVGWRHGTAVTNAAFSQEVQAWQQQLQRHPGQRFALYLQDTVSFAAVLLGAWQAGKVIYLPSDALPETCRTLAADVDGFIGDIDAQWQPLPVPQSVPAPADASRADHAPLALSADFPGLVVYTSGSTGTAQAIPKQLGQLTREVATLEQLFGHIAGACDVLATVSHQHIYGLLFKVLWPLAAGRAIHAHSAFFPEQLAAFAPSGRPWLLLSSPAHLKRLPASPVQADTQHLRAVFSSGGPLLPEVSQAAQQLFRQVPIEIYGSSETGGIAWRQVAPQGDNSWQPMPQVEVRAHADDESLEVRSRHLPDGNWLRMADRVEFVAGQTTRFLLRGRADRIVKLEEKRISLDQIERQLLTTPWVAEARVLLHPGQTPEQRDRIAAFIVLNDGGRQLLQEHGKLALNRQLRARLAEAIEHVALPRQWRYLPALPANSQGKTTAAALLALLAQPDHETASATPTPQSMSSPHTSPRLPQTSVQQRSASQVTLALHIPADLLYFQGHFSGAPVLPGVAQLDWALTLGRQYFDLPPRCLGMQALKFQHVIRPGTEVLLDLEHDTSKNALTFRLHSDQGQHASGRILLGPL